MNRTATLEALVNVSMPISEAVALLRAFSWDSESELVHLSPEHFSRALSLFKQGTLSAAEVEIWANALECRDDVDVSTSLARELLFELANPLLTQPLSGERADFLLSAATCALTTRSRTDAPISNARLARVGGGAPLNLNAKGSPCQSSLR